MRRPSGPMVPRSPGLERVAGLVLALGSLVARSRALAWMAPPLVAAASQQHPPAVTPSRRARRPARVSVDTPRPQTALWEPLAPSAASTANHRCCRLWPAAPPLTPP